MHFDVYVRINTHYTGYSADENEKLRQMKLLNKIAEGNHRVILMAFI